MLGKRRIPTNVFKTNQLWEEKMKFNNLFLTAALSLAFAQIAWAGEPKYKADVPSSILTPDKVETRIGTLRFKDGAPDDKTVELVYDNLDFMRGVEAFLDGMPAASIYGACRGYKEAGMGPQSVGIFEDLMDARSVFLTREFDHGLCNEVLRPGKRTHRGRSAGGRTGSAG